MDALLTTTTEPPKHRADAPLSSASTSNTALAGSRVSTTGVSARDAGAGTGLLTADPPDRFDDRPARHAAVAPVWSSEAS